MREAMRDFGSLLAELETGDVEKLVLTQRNRMRAVVVSIERWSEVEQALVDARGTLAMPTAENDEPAFPPEGSAPHHRASARAGLGSRQAGSTGQR